MTALSYPVLALPDIGISLFFPQDKIQIGFDPNSHIILNKEESKGVQALLRLAPERYWELLVLGSQGVWVNNHMYTSFEGAVPLQPGDVVRAGHLKFRFYLGAEAIAPITFDDFSENTPSEAQYIHVPAPDGTQEEAATESLRIVSLTPSDRYRRLKRAAVSGAVLLFMVLLAYCLISGKFLQIRNSFSHALPSQTENHKPH